METEENQNSIVQTIASMLGTLCTATMVLIMGFKEFSSKTKELEFLPLMVSALEMSCIVASFWLNEKSNRPDIIDILYAMFLLAYAYCVVVRLKKIWEKNHRDIRILVVTIILSAELMLIAQFCEEKRKKVPRMVVPIAGTIASLIPPLWVAKQWTRPGISELLICIVRGANNWFEVLKEKDWTQITSPHDWHTKFVLACGAIVLIACVVMVIATIFLPKEKEIGLLLNIEAILNSIKDMRKQVLLAAPEGGTQTITKILSEIGTEFLKCEDKMLEKLKELIEAYERETVGEEHSQQIKGKGKEIDLESATINNTIRPHTSEGTYLHNKELEAAQGVRISAQGLESAIAGTALYVSKSESDLDHLTELVTSRISKSGEGIYVQASTLGSLEALTEFLKSPAVNIPINDFAIGPVHKKDVIKASAMLEKKKEYATILALNVKVTPEVHKFAEELGVRIFVADIDNLREKKERADNLREEKERADGIKDEASPPN